MPVVVKHRCGAVLELTLDMAGKRGKCPKCGAAVTVPEHERLLQLMKEARAAHMPKGAEEKKPPAPKPAMREEEFGSLTLANDEPKAKPEARHCPTCGHTVSAEAIICVNCGTNVKTGRKIGPSDTGATQLHKPQPSPKDKPSGRKS
jgi:DNA-directed RNA polymerase subunit RPC12/RpoP